MVCVSTRTDTYIFFPGGSLNSLLEGYKKKAMLQLNSYIDEICILSMELKFAVGVDVRSLIFKLAINKLQ